MKPGTERPRTKPAHATVRKPVSKPAAKTRRAKPVFEIPQEPDQTAKAEWVYRTEFVSEPDVKKPHTRAHAQESPNILLVAGVGMFVVSIAAAGLVSLGVIGMMAAPVMLFRGIMRRTVRDA